MVLNFIKSSYKKVKNALAKTSLMLGSKIKVLFSEKIDEDTLDKLEQLFYEADLGLKTSVELTQKVRDIHQAHPEYGSEELINAIKEEIKKSLSKHSNELAKPANPNDPLVILIVGVNGNGKTTSVAKLAKKFQDNQQKVLLAAGDTFRAAAIEQLETWAQRIGADIVKGTSKSDPAAIAFDALTAAKSRECQVVLIDTAGRLHTKTHLMQELEKIKRTCKKVIPDSPHETLLVLDATTGQNAIDQAKIFNQFTPLSGIILTKLDSTAKGGIVLSIYKQLGIPIKFIGVGEGIEDLEPFEIDTYVQALFE